MGEMYRKTKAKVKIFPSHYFIPEHFLGEKYEGTDKINMIYDVTQKFGLDYEIIKEGIAADKRIGRTHLDPLHQGGRGAGGHCFIKDFAAFRLMYGDDMAIGKKDEGADLLYYAELYNKKLLRDSGKDMDLFYGVFGK